MSGLPEPAAADAPPASSVAKLTSRQQEILGMLQAGKANKEIANELGIGVGTVKQHVVALFKKLKARNRTMAVSRGIGLLRARPAESNSLKTETGLLERRPCVVLSLALPADALSGAVARLHAVLAAQASLHDAVFLARRGNAVDVIFGIQRTTEYDLAKALQIARAVRIEFGATGQDGGLRVGLAAGIAMASMGRFGGWTGEAMASGALTAARELVERAGAGCIRFGAGARELMTSCGMGPVADGDGDVPLATLDDLVWTGERRRFKMVGREKELRALRFALRSAERGRGRVVFVEGETGMGKSRLCSVLVDSCAGPVLLLRCLPGDDGDKLRDVATGAIFSVAELNKRTARRKHVLVVVDDLHFLAAANWGGLQAHARNLAARGAVVILAGRRAGDAIGDDIERIHLGRLDDAAISKLVADALQAHGRAVEADVVRSIVAMAAGVPFFATELAAHGGMTLPVFAIVCARLDGLGQDHRLLAAVAKGEAADLAVLADRWGEDVDHVRRAADRAVAVGVLRYLAPGKLAFTHPLLRMAIDFMGTDKA